MLMGMGTIVAGAELVHVQRVEHLQGLANVHVQESYADWFALGYENCLIQATEEDDIYFPE